MRLLRPLCALLLLLASLSVTSCQKPAPIPQEESIAVTYNSIAGCWQLSHLQGVPLSEQTHLYIEFERKEPRFVMWDNLNSMYTVQSTGTYTITEQEDGSYTLSGTYDNGVGAWSNDYSVSLTDLGARMLWHSSGEVLDFVRIDSIPELE
jgi:lipopolysaccharide export LptBFGC system permease protein LptF